jgi:hypothetical protein
MFSFPAADEFVVVLRDLLGPPVGGGDGFVESPAV